MWCTLSYKKVEEKLATDIEHGLTDEEAASREKKYGKNELAKQKKEGIFIKFINQFKDFMIITLLIAAVISAIMANIEKSGDYLDSIIIVAIVIFNAIMGLIQENKAEKSLEALSKLSSPNAKVKRNSKTIIISSNNLVPGDIIMLEAGNLVPADARLISSFNLKVEESSLTGETVPVLKNADVILNSNVPTGDKINLVFSSTMVTNGHGEAIVTDTGMNTKVGKIAKMIIQDKSEDTPLQKKLADVGKKLGIASLIICLLIFVIGIVKKISIMEMFMTSVGLAVAAIPEGLPVIVTIMLSIGVTKMAKNNAIIRKLPAVETLGSSSVICSDKTGTLTQNKMKVVKMLNTSSKEYASASNRDLEFMLELGCLCTDTEVEKNGAKYNLIGEPTENAIVNIALDNNIIKNNLEKSMPRVNEIPFESTRKLMSTIHKLANGKYRVITKGAPDKLLNRCSKYYENGNCKEMDSFTKSMLNKANEKNASEALRVLAISYKDLDYLPSKISSNLIEDNLTFVGFFCMIDPPREGVKEAIKSCKKAGIKTVMITGDHILTAKKIAEDLGILNPGEYAITGEELDRLDEKQFNKDIMKYSVFARVSPEHKVKIVKAFKANGNIVAMTGDGVNDAPALKGADIGVAMGLNGTDVAKNASDMVLTDDNFVTIVKAVKEGRHIYDNIKKAVHFLLATNIGEIVTIFVGLILGLKSPLLAIQLLWINLVTDSLPAIALGLEPEDDSIMCKKPKKPKEGLFSGGLWKNIFIEGSMIGILTLVAFNIGAKYSLEVGRTMAFLSLGLLELIHSFNLKSDTSILNKKLFQNKYLLGAFILGSLLQILVVLIAPVAEIFGLVSLTFNQWLIVSIISIIPIIFMEIYKKSLELKNGRTMYINNSYKVSNLYKPIK